MTAPTQAFRRLALGVAFATFGLVILGGVVRVTDSGLGCGPGGSGFHGWPLCNGGFIPGESIHSVVEYSHRTLASVVGLGMIVLAVWAWRRFRAHTGVVRASTAAALLVIGEGVLGAATVEKNLSETLVAIHLGIAMVLLAMVLYVWRASRHDREELEPADGGPRFRPLAVVAAGLVFATIVTGGYMAGTQKYGRPDYQLGDGAHHACGKQFPACNGELLPFGQTRLVDIHLTHRVFMYLAVIAALGLIALALRRRPSPRVVSLAKIAALILVAQVLLGALNVWLDEYEALIVAHLATGTLLWATLVGLAFQLYRVPVETGERRLAPV